MHGSTEGAPPSLPPARLQEYVDRELGDRVVTSVSCTALHVAVAALDVLRAQEEASRG